MPTVIYFVNNSSCFSGGGLNLSAISEVDKTIFKKDCQREIVRQERASRFPKWEL